MGAYLKEGLFGGGYLFNLGYSLNTPGEFQSMGFSY